MKMKHVIATFSLSMALGLGVFAGVALHREVKGAKAYTSRTVYCAIDTTTLGSYTLKLNVNVGDNNTWLQSDMVDLNDETSYPGKKVFQGTFEERYGGVDAMQFQLYSGSDWQAQDQVISSWKTYDNYDGKLHIYGGAANSWENYAAIPTYQVDVYVDGVKRGTEEVNEGSLPAAPSFGYGEAFSGWYDDAGMTAGHEVTSITSNIAVYGSVKTLPTVTYSYDLSRVSTVFANDIYLYAWDAGGNTGAWPGQKLTGSTFTVPNDAEIIIANKSGESVTAQTVNVIQSGVANDTLRIKSTLEGGKYTTVWTSTLDEPAKEGYYLVGSELGWQFAGAREFTYDDGNVLDANNNIAILEGYTAKANEEVKVRKFFNDESDWVQVATGQNYEFGDDSGENFVFTTAGTYDFYIQDGTCFFISTHHERHTIGVVYELFTGRTKTSFVNGVSQLAEEDVTFYPTSPSYAGYSFINFYTDHNCTTPYVPTTFDYDDTLYAKFEKNEAYNNNDGVYVVGDANFSGNVNYAWDIQGAVLLPEAVNDTANNLYEGTITIPETADELNPISIRPAFYDNGDLDYAHASCSLGQAYGFVSKNGDNFEFTAGGTYAVYVNKSLQVYFNIGADAFYTKFLTDVAGVCSMDGDTDVDALKAVWAEQKTAYLALSTADQNAIKAVGFDHGDAEGSDLEKVVAKYSYIVNKYGTSVVEDFVWNQTINPASAHRLTIAAGNNVLLVVIIASASLVTAAGLYFIIRRKKHQ